MSDETKVDDNELKAFVASTLNAIVDGVTEAQENAVASAHGTGFYRYSPPKTVSFDIAVNAKRSTGKDGGFKIQILDVGLQAGASKDQENSTVSRVQFTVENKYKKNPAKSPQDK